MIHIPIKDIISIILFVFLLIVINRQAKIIENLEDKVEDLEFELKKFKDK